MIGLPYLLGRDDASGLSTAVVDSVRASVGDFEAAATGRCAPRTESAAEGDGPMEQAGPSQAIFDHARRGEVAALEGAVAAGAGVNAQNERGDSPLMLAAYHGHVAAVRRLLELGADPGLRNQAGQSPLDGAAFKGELEVIQALLDGGAEVNAGGPEGKTALMFAAMFDRLEALELLLARGAERDRRDVEGRSALDYAGLMSASRAEARLKG